jgi:hypothetical protein
LHWLRIHVAPRKADTALSLIRCHASCPRHCDWRLYLSSKITNRWQPPQSDASGTYEGLNGERCAGGLKGGTKQLGEQIKSQFQITYGGYSCRANTANPGELSIHAIGRALDIMTSGAKGEEIANHLVTNASTLGVQLIIWNHTLWKITPTGATSRAYTGPNPHTDHVHAEVTSATAASGPGQAGTGTGTDPGATPPQDPNAPPPSDPNGPPPDPQGPVFDAGPGGPPMGGPGDDFFPDDEYEEMECRTDLDCDPSGEIFCDEGYCL